MDQEMGEVFEDLENADDEVRRPVVVTDEMRKEEFLTSLGLITQKALSELQNKKTVRKRRTTANPHFSNAAIEAKRINQMEVAARKAKRKEVTRTRYSLVARRNNNNSNNGSTSRHGEDRSLLHWHSNHSNPQLRQSSLSTSPPSSSHQTPVSQVSPFFKILSSTSRDCAACKELCQPDEVDSIIFCRSCPCLFHLTCCATVGEVATTGYFTCPQCDRRMSLADEVSDFDHDPYPMNKQSLPSNQQPVKHKRRGFKSFDLQKNGQQQDMITLNQGNNILSRVSNRSHYEEKRAELSMLLEKKEILELEWTKRREVYTESIEAFTSAQQKASVLEAEGKKIENDVNRLVGFIRSVKIWTEIIDPDDHHPLHQRTAAAPAAKEFSPVVPLSVLATNGLLSAEANGQTVLMPEVSN